MDTRDFNREAKILLTDLRAGRNPEENLQKYTGMICAAFTEYSTMKVALNVHTRREEKEDRQKDVILMNIIREAAETGLPDTPEKKERFGTLAGEVKAIRLDITEKMRAITACVDKLTMHESVLNRRIASGAEDTGSPSIEKMVSEAERFIFQDKDKMGINLRVQQIIAQLPVRMTKQRFYDILSQSISLYRGGELSAAEDFIESIRDVAGITEIDDSCLKEYEDIYSVLQHTMEVLDAIDYPSISDEGVDEAGEEIEKSAELLTELSTDLMQKQEIVNDLLILLITAPLADADNMSERYPSALELLRAVSAEETLSPEKLVDSLAGLEGLQEEAYERLVMLAADLEDIAKKMEKETGYDLRTAELLTSSSLFTDLEKMLAVNEEGRVMADEVSVNALTEGLTGDFDKLFKGMDRMKKRGIMGIVLGHVPVFFNSGDEIKEYIRYSLNQCGDKLELGAVWELLQTVIS